MKHMKKLTGVLLALVMALSLATTAFAATVTVPSDGILKGHTFTAYQVFSGREENGVLSDVKWGNDINSTAFLDALKADTVFGSLFADCGDAAAVAKVLSDNSTNTDLADKVAELAYKHKTGAGTALTTGNNALADGYYLVVDTTQDVGEGGAYNKALLQVVGNIEIKVKTSAPTVEKKVKDINDSTDDAMTGWQDSADYDIGDNIPYQLTATMGDLSEYDHYYVEFVDTMTHLTYTGITSVKVGDTTLTESQYTATWDASAKTLSVVITDVKAYGATTGTKVVVEYNATLDTEANIGSDGNPNEVYLVYSNNPNNTGDGTSKPGDTGNTPEDTVIVFTYKTIINKVTKNPDYDPKVEGSKEYIPLTGAEFTLEKYNKETGEWEAIAVVKSNDDTTFTFSGLDDGNYRLTETKTHAGYNTIAPIEFTITAEHDVLSDNPALTSLSGNVTTGEITFASNTTEGSLTTDVVNKAGATLPETGGIGTTIFYVLGGVLMLGAVVLLVTKKRMNAE